MTAVSTQHTQRRSLLGTRIVLDEEKILKENKYDLDRMYEIIDELAKESGLIKIDKHTYHCKGNDKDLACLGIFVYNNLIDCKWFTLNVKEWDWISEKEGNETLIGDDMGVWQ
ncbi:MULTISPECIES: hypothetical protein [Helicobacter]|uniref:Hybrid protein contained Cpp29 and VapD n=1 Tax=Helicobacter fennelliae TaxID=215 RepID=A0A2X3DKJ3_9HELI|nr:MULTISPECIES: hypothetical protein [Helicobacter]QOQ95544.1 hypothetical protein HW245_07880 [Helicobacter cinaedi]SQB98780.1 hybrid protein contained Cpp29 and VapD [Helicobacter fennelliae]STQ83969.1 hybrid protein contained Cpp29 and VapD [Helicobacter fennelliae]BAM12545.1 conserved hypothetical protein Cpp29 [Helicobacter cinaedi PAGU611]BBB20234.1 hypothetical protein HC081234_14110 [Helicobacter cinaedi]